MSSEMLKEPSKIDIPYQLSILPLRDTVVYPFIIVPLQVSRPKSVRLIDDAMIGDKIIGLFAQRDSKTDDPDLKDIYQFGTAARIIKKLRMPDDSIQIFVQGIERIRIKNFLTKDPYFKAEIEEVKYQEESDIEALALVKNVTSLFEKLISISPHLPKDLAVLAMNIEEPDKLSDLIAANLGIKLEENQEILETISPKERLKKLTAILNRELEILELSSKIQSEVKTDMDKTHKEYFLRQQLKAIQKELGEEDEKTVEINELKAKIKEAKMPKNVEEVATKEVERLSLMHPSASEYSVARTYIDWLVNLPWSKSTTDNLDIDQASKILDEDHYDLEKVKERILEYLAVHKLKKDMKGTILCFVGPPGVGKTSLGKSIARSIGRKFIRISLGGVRDEAEIRGHRRTYVGALPGRVIQGIKNVGSNNPLFMIDEIDKIGTDFRGDPSSALLEVLDPEQNNSFSDHYLDVPFDLSKVIFIATANILDPIPPALKDRMEVLHLPGYTEEEKIKIAKKYLIPKQIKENGLRKRQITFEDKAISRIITEYTREAGLRNLEREIGSICRKVAKMVAGGKKKPLKITPMKIPAYLGPIKFFSEVAEMKDDIGTATGLAWTPSGGEILFIEATKMKGKKGLVLTGQLGDVMKESAQAALSYIRSKAKLLKIDEDFFNKYDIHIHIPSGAIPKDGPSAGITMTTALASLLSERPVKHNIAMTGEITLRGKVLPVGGVKEKVLAAKRAGINQIILPKKNKRDIQEIPKNVLKGLSFRFVDNMDSVLKIALVNERNGKSKTKRK
ncbi:MAG TPA: endopeptidase La [Nitrospinota bacterium]|nr:endopeptidase La [Nitrospinota bacterium]